MPSCRGRLGQRAANQWPGTNNSLSATEPIPDGYCEDQGTVYVPPGRSVWELSTQSRDPPKKAAQDLKKRTAATDADEQARTSVVLVTSRRLPDKDRHEKAWRKLGQWRPRYRRRRPRSLD